MTVDDDSTGARADLKHRAIRSFVVRAGRQTAKQTRGLTEGFVRHGIAYNAAPLDIVAAFARHAPTVMEIGFGMGVTTAVIASAQPDTHFIAV